MTGRRKALSPEELEAYCPRCWERVDLGFCTCDDEEENVLWANARYATVEDGDE